MSLAPGSGAIKEIKHYSGSHKWKDCEKVKGNQLRVIKENGQWGLTKETEETSARFPHSLSLFPSGSSLHMCSLKLKLDCGSLPCFQPYTFENKHGLVIVAHPADIFIGRQDWVGVGGEETCFILTLLQLCASDMLCQELSAPCYLSIIPLDPSNTIKYRFKKQIIDFFFSDYLL